MPFNDAAMQAAADAIRAVAGYGQLHSGAAGTLYTDNVSTAGRQSITWAVASGLGDFGLAAQVDFDGGEAGGPVFSVTLWSAAADGTCYGEFPITAGDATFSATGRYSLTVIDITGETDIVVGS